MTAQLKDKLIIMALFLGSFAIYMVSVAPSMAPYRDVGEMVCLLETLGVAHPPGYPLYTIAGKFSSWIPLGNIAYRINLFSAFCGAGALVVLFLVLRKWVSLPAALLGVGFFGFSNPFWELNSVSEMYAMGVFLFCLVMWAFFIKENMCLFAFLMGLSLGVRMDLLLMGPVFAFLMWKTGKLKNILALVVFFGLGLTVFLYLPIRSFQDPVIDWANPETFERLFNSVSRKSYSGTLDLLSLNYAKGENFFVNMQLYASHLLDYFGVGGTLLAIFGMVKLVKEDKIKGPFVFLSFFISGPVFLFLANMPPNPHAVAIVEAAYLIPDLMIGVAAAFGLFYLFQKIPMRSVAVGVALVLVVVNGVQGYERGTRRQNYFTRDYLENVFRSTPRGSIIAFHKDVQLFSLWKAQLIDRRRLDLAVVATGLSSSPWYHDMMLRWGTAFMPPISLKSDKGWLKMAQASKGRWFAAGHETSIPRLPNTMVVPHGMIARLDLPDDRGPAPPPYILDELAVYRGHYRYGETPDFFSSDLVSDHARAYQRQGHYYLSNKDYKLATWFFLRAEQMDPSLPAPTSNRGYIALVGGDFKKALGLFSEAARKYDKQLQLTQDYKSLPDVVNGLNKDYAETLVYIGNTYERLKRISEARAAYRKAGHVSPSARAYYNLGATYWGNDWDEVIRSMSQALRLNPRMEQAAKYLAVARQKKAESQQ